MELMAEYLTLHQQHKNNPYPSLSERKKIADCNKKKSCRQKLTLWQKQ